LDSAAAAELDEDEDDDEDDEELDVAVRTDDTAADDGELRTDDTVAGTLFFDDRRPSIHQPGTYVAKRKVSMAVDLHGKGSIPM